MKRVFAYHILPEQNHMKIGDFLVGKGYTRHIRTYLKQHPGSVLRNGEPALFYQLLETGDSLTVCLIDELPSEKIKPVPLPIHIVYEDEDILIVNKPADMPIHPSIGNYENTLANGIAWYYNSQNISFVYRCINRLDRDTTGLLIIAKNMLSGAVLSGQMKTREIHRTYLAIVEGRTPESGTISAPIGRVSDSVIERKIDEEHGDPAVTHYRRLAYCEGKKFAGITDDTGILTKGASLVQLRLETGRTHQIRVHMTSIGHPLPGDTLYNPTTTLMKRQALHSYSLEFSHPITGESMRFSAPLPEDMAQFFPI